MRNIRPIAVGCLAQVGLFFALAIALVIVVISILLSKEQSLDNMEQFMASFQGSRFLTWVVSTIRLFVAFAGGYIASANSNQNKLLNAGLTGALAEGSRFSWNGFRGGEYSMTTPAAFFSICYVICAVLGGFIQSKMASRRNTNQAISQPPIPEP